MEIDHDAPPPQETLPLDLHHASPSVTGAEHLTQPSPHQDLDTSQFSPDRRPKKSSTTCTTCRARKVRCNGGRPLCSNCHRLGFPCSYDDGEGGTWPSTLPRRRVKQACASCHSRKARCSGHVPACDRCRAQGTECVYRPNKRVRGSNQQHGSADGTSPQSHDDDKDSGHPDSDSGLLDHPSGTLSTHNYDDLSEESFDGLMVKTFDKFFRNVHHIPMYSFLHRASLSEQYHAAKVDKALLLALVGITTCLTDMGPGMQEFGDRCIDDAEALIFSDYARPSTIKVQALVFMIKHRILNNRFPSAFMLLSIASRYAVALRLNREAPNLCFLAQESRRRLVWTLYCIDCGVSGGYQDFSLWRPENIHVGLPCNERNFEFDLPQPTEKLEIDTSPRSPQAEDVGSLALHVRIHHIRQHIIEFNKSVLTSRDVNTGDLQTRVLQLHKELDDFAAHLPLSFQFSDNSLRLRAYSPRICVFVMIHVWWRQCHTDLYRLALVGLREALPRAVLAKFDDSFIEHCQRQCADHSLAMASIFSAIQKLNVRFVADLDLGICAYQCARMLTYAYHTNSVRFDLGAEKVLEQARICLLAIKQCCVGSAAAGIRGDLEKLISHGLSARNTPSRIATPEGGRKRGRGNNSSHTLSRQSLLKDTGADAVRMSSNGNARNDKSNKNADFSAAGSGVTSSALPPSIMTDPWIQESPEATEPAQVVRVTRGKQDVMHITPESEFEPSELNNAYEGAIGSLGMDNGLDYALGLDLNLWVPTGDWMGTGDFTINGTVLGGGGVPGGTGLGGG